MIYIKLIVHIAFGADMAQLNTRVKDESKEKAEPVLAAAGYTFSSYFSALTDYIAETGSLPVQIRYKPAVVNPEEIFSEALLHFKTVWGRLKSFTESLQAEQPLPHRMAMTAMQDIEDAYRFYRTNEDLILSAPGQRMGSPAEGYQRFPASLDGINQLYGTLRLIISNLISLAVITAEHLEFSKQQINEAAESINTLQTFTGNGVSSDALNQMIIRDAGEAIDCAKQALIRDDHGNGIPQYAFSMWHERYVKLLDSVRSMQRRAGATEATLALTELCEQLAGIEIYLDKLWQLRKGKLNGGVLTEEGITEVAEEHLRTFRVRAGDMMQIFTHTE